MTAAPEFCSSVGTMNGGAIMLVYDMCATMRAVPLSRKALWHFGALAACRT
ncbi:hypothetical protein K432DRAFT_319925, partial [Lepidopterella palustris CBS 459.81]